MAPADLRHQLRQVVFQVAAKTEEYRHDPQGPDAIAMQHGGALRQRRLHQFKEGERDAFAGQALAEFDYELLERPCPVRVARAVGEKDDCLSYGRSLFHGAIMFDAAASR